MTILEHDTNKTVTSYELTVTEPFEEFVRQNEIMEMRLELEDVLKFDKRYDARVRGVKESLESLDVSDQPSPNWQASRRLFIHLNYGKTRWGAVLRDERFV